MAVIELLRIQTARGRRAEFLARDAALWTPALAAHEGFVSKETWISHDDHDRVTLVIRWVSLAHWQRFPAAIVEELDARMADLQESLVCETYEETP
jgi:uncharacterized protein (TIGR03792 family)